jgi:hypothetical protein
MLGCASWNGASAQGRAGKVSRSGWWFAMLLAVPLLTACEHGSMTYNRSTGTFNMPFGVGSNR